MFVICTLKTEYRDQSILNIYLIEVKTSEVAKMMKVSLVIKNKQFLKITWTYNAMYVDSTHPQEVEVRLSEEERRVDALALRADERRDKLRKATGSCK